MKAVAIKGAILLLITLVQVSLLPRLSLGKLQPDFFLIVTCCWALIDGSRMGVGSGFVAGLLQDLYGSGSNIFIKPAMGYLSGRFEGKVYKDSLAFPPLIVLGASFLGGIITFLVHEEYLFNLTFSYALRNIILPGALINAVLCLGVYPFLLWVERKMKEMSRGVY